jgi:hypothetical protein
MFYFSYSSFPWLIVSLNMYVYRLIDVREFAVLFRDPDSKSLVTPRHGDREGRSRTGSDAVDRGRRAMALPIRMHERAQKVIYLLFVA